VFWQPDARRFRIAVLQNGANMDHCQHRPKLIPRNTVLLEKLTVSQLLKLLMSLYGTLKFITACKIPYQWEPSRIRSIQFTTPNCIHVDTYDSEWGSDAGSYEHDIKHPGSINASNFLTGRGNARFSSRIMLHGASKLVLSVQR